MTAAGGRPDQPARLSDSPDWAYLLEEIETLYRYGSPGGSTRIAEHQQRVCGRLRTLVAADPPLTPRTGTDLPVLAHFGRAIDRGSHGPLSGMTLALARVGDQLPWEFGYDDVPEPLTRNLGWCELVGPRGPVRSEELILGAVLLAPSATYPQHSHEEIEESYVSLSGAWSENDAAVYAPGSLILNRRDEQHRITVGDAGPCLIVFAWVATAERLREPHTWFGRPQSTE